MDTIIVFALVGLAAVYLVHRWFKKGASTCDDCPGCSHRGGLQTGGSGDDGGCSCGCGGIAPRVDEDDNS